MRSVAMSQTVHDALVGHLLRGDGQEDICLATYAESTGARRVTQLLAEVHLPRPGERHVHGNATIMGSYVLRVAGIASRTGRGIAILHSHPGGRGWQGLSGMDTKAEASFEQLAKHVTGLPLLGLTLAGDATWSARVWIDGRSNWARSVRIVGTGLRVDWNGAVVPSGANAVLQARTISAWGDEMHADITRLRVLVVGVGSVGLDVVQRLAATGLHEIGIMDFDHVERLNLDRMIGATMRDARLGRPKVDVATRLARRCATSTRFKVHRHEDSVCTASGLATALDYDLIFSCVDRPLPRALLNTIAYSDLIPVIDGGIGIDAFEHGGMRGATRRVQSAVPGRPCLICSEQLSPVEVALDASGDLDDPEYIRRAGLEPYRGRANVAALAAGVSSGQLDQFVSLVARPGGFGAPGPLRFILATHTLQHLEHTTQPYCPTELDLAAGDQRSALFRQDGEPTIGASHKRHVVGWLNRAFDHWVEWIENRD